MNWFQTYTRIAFELHAALEAAGEMYFVDTYYGPEAWRADSPPADLRRTLDEMDGLRAALPPLTDSPTRREYLEANLRALETVCRYLLGEPMSLREAARGMLDVEPVPIPDTVMETYRRKVEEALGGSGTLAERYARVHARALIHPEDDDALLRLFEEAIAAARARARAILPLPDEEGVDISIIRNVYLGASNWYKGKYRSAMEINGDRPTTLFRLLLLACHEGYPGHHTESTLKEKFLYRERGLTEQCLFFNGPQVVIAEGIATLAGPVAFPAAEAAAWIAEGYRAFGQPLDGMDLPLLMEALWSVDPDGMATNALLMAEDGAPPEDVIGYALRFALSPEEEVRRSVMGLYEGSLLRRVYQLSYYHGRHLMEPLLQGDDRLDVWRAFHTEQWTPGMLRSRNEAREG